MSDKSNPTPGQFFAIPGLQVLALEGEDAVRFAQAQFMSDVAALADTHWHFSGWLNPKGRILALFALLRRDAHTLWLVVPGLDVQALANDLQRYVFRSKVRLTPLPALHAIGAFHVPGSARGASAGITTDGSVELDMRGEQVARSLRLSSVPGENDPAAATRWAACDLAHGWPWLPGSELGQWTPQQLSLDRVRAYSVKKGCYPGQEIVARTHFLGQAKRGLARLQTSGPVEAGTPIEAAGQALGRVICNVHTDVLAVLPDTLPDTPLTALGHTLVHVPLQAGLAR